MNQLLHVSSAAVKETEDGNVSTITLGAVSAHASELIPLVGEQVILRTPGQQGRSFGGSLSALLVKDTKSGPEVTVKVVGGTVLNGLVGTNVEIEAAQIPLPLQQAVENLRPKKGSGIDAVTISSGDRSVTLRAKDEIASLTLTDDSPDQVIAGSQKPKNDAQPAATAGDLENF